MHKDSYKNLPVFLYSLCLGDTQQFICKLVQSSVFGLGLVSDRFVSFSRDGWVVYPHRLHTEFLAAPNKSTIMLQSRRHFKVTILAGNKNSTARTCAEVTHFQWCALHTAWKIWPRNRSGAAPFFNEKLLANVDFVTTVDILKESKWHSCG